MAKLETWISPVQKIDDPIEVVVTDRYVDPETGEPAKWTLVPLDSDRTEEIQEACMETVTDPQTGAVTRQLNALKYVNGLTAETLKDPNLRDPQIQEFYGTKGSAVKTLGKMLRVDEKDVLIKEINKIYKLNPAALQEMVDDAKNGSEKDN